MPDHWHALLAIREPWTLPKFMHSFMSHVGAKTIENLVVHESGWQEGYYETRIRTSRQFEFVSRYILENPVKKALVEQPQDWEASSAARTDLVTDPWPWTLDEE
jgi:REP element-mobilizing transposase RayT